MPAPRMGPPGPTGRTKAAPDLGAVPPGASRPPEEGVAVTHPERVVFPDLGLTKGDVFAYYGRIADRLLPFLKDRPITLERLPEGLAGEGAPHFWQKDTPASYPDWIPRVELPSERGKAVHYALVNDVQTLLYLVNQGTLTFHVWASRVGSLDRPDFVLFDLDPGSASFADAVAVAKALRTTLKGEGERLFVKTSGKTGLHVLLPWTGEGDHGRRGPGRLGVAEKVVGAMPDRATVEVRKAKRGATGLHRRHAERQGTPRGPSLCRAGRAGGDDLDAAGLEGIDGHDLDPASFRIETIFRRLAHQKRDPMAGLVRGFARPGVPGEERARAMSSASSARIVTTELLKTLPLVEHGDDASKADRGKLLIVAGSPQLPGTAILAARAALRVGCGTVRVAAPASVCDPDRHRRARADGLAAPRDVVGNLVARRAGDAGGAVRIVRRRRGRPRHGRPRGYGSAGPSPRRGDAIAPGRRCAGVARPGANGTRASHGCSVLANPHPARRRDGGPVGNLGRRDRVGPRAGSRRGSPGNGGRPCS